MQSLIKEYNAQVGLYYPDTHIFMPVSGRAISSTEYNVDLGYLDDASDEVKKRYLKEVFPFGTVTAVYLVRNYQVVEVLIDDVVTGAGQKIRFYSYVNFDSLDKYSATFNGALIDCIAFAQGDPDAAKYMKRLVCC